MSKLFPLFLLFLITFLKFNRSMETWKEKNDNFLDYDDINPNFLEDNCGDNEICQNNFNDVIKRKPKEPEEASLKTDFIRKKSNRLPYYYHSSKSLSCLCGIEYRPLDLGPQYYPRRLQTGVCKPDLCGGLYKCTEERYKVLVLKRRDPRNPLIPTPANFPDNLKNAWQPEDVFVTIACKCSL